MIRIRLYKRSFTRYKDNVPDFLLEELFHTLSPQAFASSMYDPSSKDERKSKISASNPIRYFFLLTSFVMPHRRRIIPMAIMTYKLSPSLTFENIDSKFISLSFYDLSIPNPLSHSSISKPGL